MQILYLHQFFITRAGVGGTRSYEFARRFVARGHRVRMVTAGAGQSSVDGVDVVGVPGAYSDYMSATASPDRERMLAFGRFAAAGTAEALRGPRPDVIYATSPPLTIAVPALAAAARWRAPLVFEVRDLWPEAPIQMGALVNPRLQRQARSLEREAYRRARRVIALSPGIRDGVIGAGVAPAKVVLIPNASDLDLFRPTAPPERFLVSYFGTMGEANDLTLAVARRGGGHVVRVGPRHAHDLDALDGAATRARGYHPHPVPPRDEAARELVRARATHSRAGDEELVQVEDPHR